jgi:hypothetical protein
MLGARTSSSALSAKREFSSMVFQFLGQHQIIDAFDALVIDRNRAEV